MSKLGLREVRGLVLRNTSASLTLGPCVFLSQDHNPVWAPQVSGIWIPELEPGLGGCPEPHVIRRHGGKKDGERGGRGGNWEWIRGNNGG